MIKRDENADSVTHFIQECNNERFKEMKMMYDELKNKMELMKGKSSSISKSLLLQT